VHGVIFIEFKKFVDQNSGGDSWGTMLAESGLAGKLYTPLQEYPDNEIAMLIATAAGITGKEFESLLTEFGEFMVPDLLALYRRQIDPSWSVMDLLSRVEGTIHNVVRLRNPGASPPQLLINRAGANRVIIYYTSPRKLCALGIGLVAGIGKAYKASLKVEETTCMLRGDDKCTIEITQIAQPMSESGIVPGVGKPKKQEPALTIQSVPNPIGADKYADESPIIIVGMGLVGVHAAREILRRKPGYPVVVYGEEPWEPYNRVRLSELLAGDVTWAEIAIPLHLASTDNIRLHTNTQVIGIDPKDKRIIDADGNRIAYSHLILATGSRPRPADTHGKKLSGIHTYRNIDDAQHLLVNVIQSNSTVVLGGGVLGIEVAFALKQQNPRTKVTLMHRNAYLMNRELDRDTADFLLGQVEKMGILVRFNTSITEYMGDTALERVRLTDGEILDCDTLVACTGIIPNVELAREADLDVGRGIKVDDFMQASDPFIYAAGECLEYDGKTYGTLSPGMEQAAVAVQNILYGNHVRYRDTVSSTRVKIKHLPVFSLISSEEITDGKAITTLHFRDEEKACYRQLNLHRGRLVGAKAVGQWDEVAMVQAAIDKRARVWPWRRRYFIRQGAWSPDANVIDFASLPESAIICACSNVTWGELSAAMAEGATTTEELGMRIHAAQSCGSCKPLLARLVGAPAKEDSTSALLDGPWLFLLSLITALLPILYALPGFSGPQSVENIEPLRVFLFDGFWRQVSGYLAFGFFVSSLTLSANKRLKVLTFLPYATWLVVHVTLIFLAAASLLVHTNFSLGEQIGTQTMLLFLGLIITGTLLTGTLFLERTFFGFFVRRHRAAFLRFHNTLVSVFFVYVLFHITSIYYF